MIHILSQRLSEIAHKTRYNSCVLFLLSVAAPFLLYHSSSMSLTLPLLFGAGCCHYHCHHARQLWFASNQGHTFSQTHAHTHTDNYIAAALEIKEGMKWIWFDEISLRRIITINKVIGHEILKVPSEVYNSKYATIYIIWMPWAMNFGWFFDKLLLAVSIKCRTFFSPEFRRCIA